MLWITHPMAASGSSANATSRSAGARSWNSTTATAKYTAFAARDNGRILSPPPATERPKYPIQTIPARRAAPISTRAVSARDVKES